MASSNFSSGFNNATQNTKNKTEFVNIANKQNPYFQDPTPKKITLYEFCQAEMEMAISCRTEVDIDFVCKMLASRGQYWKNGTSYLNWHWTIPQISNVFLTNKGTYGIITRLSPEKYKNLTLFSTSEVDWLGKKPIYTLKNPNPTPPTTENSKNKLSKLKKFFFDAKEGEKTEVTHDNFQQKQ